MLSACLLYFLRLAKASENHMPFTDLPLDVLQPIINHLSGRRDFNACTLVNKSFNHVSTPLLYRTLDSRIRRSRLLHPSSTLLARPDLAKHVRHVTETGAVHFAHRQVQPGITRDTVKALALCTHLTSLTWTDDYASASYTTFSVPFTLDRPQRQLVQPPTTRQYGAYPLHTQLPSEDPEDERHPLLVILTAIRLSSAPLKELTIRSNSDLGAQVWDELSRLTGLSKIGIWCIEGPPRVLQGWAGKELGGTLVGLELGRCAGVPPTILISVLSQLPLLQDLHIKGVPAATVLTLLTLLPHLQTLDTEFINSGTGNIWPRGWPVWLLNSPSPSPSNEGPPPPSHQTTQQEQQTDTTVVHVALPTLRTLTVRTSSIDSMGPNKLFPWLRALTTSTGLESFRLLSFTTNGYTAIPRGFILQMARLHAGSLKKWIVGQAEMTLSDIECVCGMFGGLEELVCSTAVVVGNVGSIRDAISAAKNMNTLRLHVQWIPSQKKSKYGVRGPLASAPSPDTSPTSDDSGPGTSPQPSDTSDLDEETDPESEDAGETMDTRANLNHLRLSGDRGAFVFDRIGLRYANLSPYSAGGHKRLQHSEPLDYDNCRSAMMPSGGRTDPYGGGGKRRKQSRLRPFTLEQARDMMLSEGSKLRTIAVGGVVYTGKWVWDKEEGCKKFVVEDAKEE